MKEKRLLEALSEVNEKFIEEVDFMQEGCDEQNVLIKDLVEELREEECVQQTDGTENIEICVEKERMMWKGHAFTRWQKWIAAAAVLVLVYILGGQYLWQGNHEEKAFAASIQNGRAVLGEEDVLFTKNPWKKEWAEAEYPVYKNLSYVQGAGGAPYYFTAEELMEMAKAAAEKLGTETTGYYELCGQQLFGEREIETRSNVYQITVRTELADIRVSGNGEIAILFHEAVELPDGYQFSDDNTYEEAVQLTQYLVEKYKDLLGFEHMENVCSISYDLTGNKNIFYSAYNAKSNESDSIVDYCFRNVSFYGNKDGLTAMHYGDVLTAAEYLGEYRVISEEEARIRLENGQYFSMYSEEDTVGGGFSDENIRLVELTYLTGSNCQYYQPYYCFYIEAESNVEGIANYNTFYVPALGDGDLEKFPEEYPLGN